MIALEEVTARRKPLALTSVSLALGAGQHAIVGGPMDGGELVLELFAGLARPRTGRVQVLGASPDASRRAIAFVPKAAPLPDALTVAEALLVAATLRGGDHPAPADRLATLGLDALASRRIRSLAPDEARAVAMCEALTSPAVRVVLIDEPFVNVDPRAVANLPATFAARAAEGACVVVATASPSDAAAIAGAVFVMARGRLLTGGPARAMARAFAGAGVRVVSSNARALVAALAEDAAVQGLETLADAVVVRGADASGVAAAVARAAITANVEIHDLRAELPTMEQLQAAAGGAR